MMQMDLAEWLLFTVAMYPLVGLVIFAISIIATSSERMREIEERNNCPPIWVSIVAASLAWPFCIASAVRKGRT